MKNIKLFVCFFLLFSCIEENKIIDDKNLSPRFSGKDLQDILPFIVNDLSELNQDNARITSKEVFGPPIQLICGNGNSINDYRFNYVVSGYVLWVDWYIIYPSGLLEYQGRGGERFVKDFIDPEPGIYRVLADIYFEACDDSLCGVGNCCGWYTLTELPFAEIQNFFNHVSAGSTKDLESIRSLHRFHYPSGKSADDVIDMAIEYQSNKVFTWYTDGTVTVGSTVELDKYETTTFSLPLGYNISQIVGIGVDGTMDRFVFWFNNGKRSFGTYKDADAEGLSQIKSYSLPQGYTYSDIVAMAIDEKGSNTISFVWFKDGMRCGGTSTDLDSRWSLTRYYPPCNFSTSNIIGIGIDGDTDNCFYYFNR